MTTGTNYRALYADLVAGTRAAVDLTTADLRALCWWNDGNGEYDQNGDESDADYRASLLGIVTTWVEESRAEVR